MSDGPNSEIPQSETVAERPTPTESRDEKPGHRQPDYVSRGEKRFWRGVGAAALAGGSLWLTSCGFEASPSQEKPPPAVTVDMKENPIIPEKVQQGLKSLGEARTSYGITVPGVYLTDREGNTAFNAIVQERGSHWTEDPKTFPPAKFTIRYGEKDYHADLIGTQDQSKVSMLKLRPDFKGGQPIPALSTADPKEAMKLGSDLFGYDYDDGAPGVKQGKIIDTVKGGVVVLMNGDDFSREHSHGSHWSLPFVNEKGEHIGTLIATGLEKQSRVVNKIESYGGKITFDGQEDSGGKFDSMTIAVVATDPDLTDPGKLAEIHSSAVDKIIDN